MKKTPYLLVVGLFGWLGCYYDVESELNPAYDCDTYLTSFSSHIEPLVAQNCMGCHSGDSPDGGLALTTYAEIRSAAFSGAIEDRVNRGSGDAQLMPPNGPLSSCNLEYLTFWIAAGAPEN